MSLFEVFDARFATWLVSALAHLLWQGSALGLAALIAGHLLQRSSADRRYLLYTSALFLTLACLPFNLWWLYAQSMAPPASQSQHARLAAHPASTATPPAKSLARGAKADVARTDGTASPPRRHADASALTDESTAESPITRTSAYAPWIAAAYGTGIGVMLARLLAAMYGSHRLRRRAIPVDDPALLATLARLRTQIGLRLQPLVAYSTSVATPVVVGVLRPAILVPAALLTQLSPLQVESLLLHELAHLRRYDHVVNLLQRAVETVLFFHPAVWWLSHRIST